MDKRQVQPEKVRVPGTGIHKRTREKREKQDLPKVPSRFSAATGRVSAWDCVLMCILTKCSAQKISFQPYTVKESSCRNTVNQKVFALRGYRREQAGRSREDSSAFTTWEADASCSHSQDCEDDKPGIRALGRETGVCIHGPETRYLTYLAPKTRTCGTKHLVPVRQCGERQALEAHQILQKHS